MSAVAWGAVVGGVVLAVGALGMALWRRRLDRALPGPVVDLSAAEAAAREEALAFDGIVGHLLLTDPTFADTASRLARQDDADPAA